MLTLVLSSDLDWIQTSNLLSRNQVRYSVAPRGRLAVANIEFYCDMQNKKEENIKLILLSFFRV